MASITDAVLCAAVASLYWTGLGLAIARRIVPGALALPVAPAVGWAVHSAIALPVFFFIPFSAATIAAVAAIAIRNESAPGGNATTYCYGGNAAGQGACARSVPIAKKSQLGAKLAAGKFVAFVEILPPRGVDASREIEGARLCAEARHRLHQRARRSARQRPHERAGHLPAHPAAGRNRSRATTSAAATATFSASSPNCWARTRRASAT